MLVHSRYWPGSQRRFVLYSLRKILHGVGGNFARSQKLGVIVAGGKTERWAIIGLYDTDKIAANLILRPHHAVDAMVVGGNRRRPVAQFAVGVTQIAGRADGGSKGIEALINRMDSESTASRPMTSEPVTSGPMTSEPMSSRLMPSGPVDSGFMTSESSTGGPMASRHESLRCGFSELPHAHGAG